MYSLPSRRVLVAALAAFLCVGSVGGALGQQPTSGHGWTNIVVPQLRCWPSHGQAALRIQGVKASVVIEGQVARTTIEVLIGNPHSAPIWGTVCLPLPLGAHLKGCWTAEGKTTIYVVHDAAALDAKALESLAYELRDPALLEFMGHGLVRSRPIVVANGLTRKVRVTYEQVLAADGNRVDYVLPRSIGISSTTQWDISVTIRDSREVTMVYSPSHPMEVERKGPAEVTLRVPKKSARDPGAFRLSYLLGGDGLTSSIITFPEAGTKGGWFLLLAGLPLTAPDTSASVKRELTLVLDRSGSMNGEKFEQAREAAKQIVAGLNAGEAFNIIVYNASIEPFAPGPVIKNKDTERKAHAFLDSLKSGGGTNLHDALKTALASVPAEGMLPLVLFLTDGLPTVGNTSEIAIRDLASKSNPHERRVFTFGVGYNVNTALLEKIAAASGGKPTFVLPGQDVEVKVARVFKRLQGPVLTDPVLAVLDASGAPALGRVHDMVPGRLTDFFEGDQLVLLGRYTGTEPLTFRISGHYRGEPRSFDLEFRMDQGGQDHAYVARLWAGRKIAELVDVIRQMGADMPVAGARPGMPPKTDPRIDELVKSIVALSTRFGIVTEYTEFMTRAETDLSDKKAVLADANGNFVRRAMSCRSGKAGMNQSLNGQAQQRAQAVNIRNLYWDENMNQVVIQTVQQVGDLAFYKRKLAWVDSRVVTRGDDLSGVKVVIFGSRAWHPIAAKLKHAGLLGCLSLPGDILVVVDGQSVLIRRVVPQKSALGK